MTQAILEINLTPALAIHQTASGFAEPCRSGSRQHVRAAWRPGHHQTPRSANPRPAAAQALRQAVIWRKLSFSTQPAAGSRFVERLLTVVETCRRQKRNMFSWMVESVEDRFADKIAPSLLSGV